MQDYTDSMTYTVHGSNELSFRSSAALRRRLALSCCLFLSVAAGASGQRLLELSSLVDDPLGVAEGADLLAATVDLDLVRSAPDRLELLTPDGRILVAELSVFEDRGDGDVMWAGGFPEWGFESVVLSITDGRLVGRFGEPDGAKYRITTGPTGSGLLVDTAQIRRDPETVQCPGGVVPEDRGPVPAVEAASADPPERVAEESNHNLLDIVVVYTSRAEEVWGFDNLQTPEDDSTTPEAASQASIDYLNMVLRNGELDVQARLVHVEQAPTVLDGERTCGDLLFNLRIDRQVQALRAEHDADTVHIFAASEVTGCCGLAYLLQKGGTSRSFSPFGYGLSRMQGCVAEETFAHEIGHNLGAHHDPMNAGENFEETRQNTITPYAFGHTWFSPSAPNPPDIDTIMSYGIGRVEPWFSTVREEPNRWVLGIAGERENERALREVGLGIAVDYSDFLTGGSGPPPPEPPPPPGPRPTAPDSLTVMPTGSTSAKVAWVDRSDNENGFEVHARLQGARWATVKRLPADTEAADVDGLVSGGRYDFRVRAFNDNGGNNSNVVTVVLEALEYTDCVPTAPQITFDHGYTVSMCIEYLDKGVGPIVKADARDYGLDSRESGVLYFFDRDNSEVLVKVLDACAVNGYRWVFVAPVTTLAFNLYVEEIGSEEPPWTHRNPKGDQTATTKSDLQAFPCETAGASVAAAIGGDGIHGVDLVDAGFEAAPGSQVTRTPIVSTLQPRVTVAQPISGGEETDCEPQQVLSLSGGYTVNMCVEYLKDGEAVVVGAKDYELDSEQSAILYFFDRNNAEVLIKVLDGCDINGHRWVFVAPVTSLAFNLTVEPPEGEVWKHDNRLNQTAEARSDITAFACSQ